MYVGLWVSFPVGIARDLLRYLWNHLVYVECISLLRCVQLRIVYWTVQFWLLEEQQQTVEFVRRPFFSLSTLVYYSLWSMYMYHMHYIYFGWCSWAEYNSVVLCFCDIYWQCSDAEAQLACLLFWIPDLFFKNRTWCGSRNFFTVPQYYYARTSRVCITHITIDIRVKSTFKIVSNLLVMVFCLV